MLQVSQQWDVWHRISKSVVFANSLKSCVGYFGCLIKTVESVQSVKKRKDCKKT